MRRVFRRHLAHSRQVVDSNYSNRLRSAAILDGLQANPGEYSRPIGLAITTLGL